VTNIVCIKQGGFYKAEYVTKLYRGLKRNATLPFRFVCFTEIPFKDDEIEVRPLPYQIVGWWNKIPLFAPPECIADDQIVCIDLDVVITGNIDWLIKWRGKFGGLPMFTNEYGATLKYYNGSLWSLEPGANTHVWENFEHCGYEVMKTYYSDQEWIAEQVKDGINLNKIFPGYVLSFRHDYLDVPEDKRRVSDNASIYLFHGFPKPGEVHKVYPWIREHWTI